MRKRACICVQCKGDYPDMSYTVQNRGVTPRGATRGDNHAHLKDDVERAAGPTQGS